MSASFSVVDAPAENSASFPLTGDRKSRPACTSWTLLAQTFEYSSGTTPASRGWPSCMISCVSSRRGKFITFEGLDGCGKSTQMERLAHSLRKQDLSVTVTREPGGTAAGEQIRHLLLDTRTSGLAPMAELALMFAARAQHAEEGILAPLAAGQIVLCHRFTAPSQACHCG